MPVRDIVDREGFDAALAKGPAVAYFWASWCAPCKQMDEVVAELAKQHPAVSFLRVEAEEVDAVAEQCEVSQVPCFLLFKEGRSAGRVEGADAASLTAKVAALAGPAPPAPPAPGAGPAAAGAAAAAAGGGDALRVRLQALLARAPVMLFMKGSPDAPRCGFSSKVVEALRAEGIPFQSFDILQDEAVRAGLKELSSWPTYPQLYVNGELLGGCDIVLEMAGSGQLKEAVDEMAHRTTAVGGPAEPPSSAMAAAATATAAAATSTGACAAGAAAGGGQAGMSAALRARLEALLQQAPVMAFIKGSPDAPRCGFSGKVVEALRGEGIAFQSFDILQDEAVRAGLKQLSSWPTYPQLYVNGELLGGCDIVLEMREAGELKEAVEEMMHRTM